MWVTSQTFSLRCSKIFLCYLFAPSFFSSLISLAACSAQFKFGTQRFLLGFSYFPSHNEPILFFLFNNFGFLKGDKIEISPFKVVAEEGSLN